MLRYLIAYDDFILIDYNNTRKIRKIKYIYSRKLQRKYHITITGPTTMSALLNSLQMGFRTLAVTKRSSEVWKILEAVKTEFGKFSTKLELVDKQLSTAKRSLEDLRNTRTNMMQSKLRKVGTLDREESDRLLDLKQVDEAQEQPSE